MKKEKKTIVFIVVLILGLLVINKFGKEIFKSNTVVDTKLINVPKGYECSIMAKGLKNPSSFAIDKENNIYIAENINDKGRIVKYNQNGKTEVIANELVSPVSQIIFNKNVMYISHKGKISKIQDGFMQDLITALPSFGDYSNNGISIGNDGMIYICQGSATNSAVVGVDNFENKWLSKEPYFHDYPPRDTVLRGVNYKSKNPLTAEEEGRTHTGAFKPFGSITDMDEVIKGRLPGNSCIMRIETNGTNLDLFAWGIRNPIGIVTLQDGRIYITVRGMDNRGSRAVAKGRDYVYEIKKGMWLGWPDYEGSEPVTLQKFKPKKGSSPEFLTNLHPTTQVLKPMASFEECGRIGIMDMCKNSDFGYRGQLFIPFKNGDKQQAKIAILDTRTNGVSDFITNSKDSDFLKNPVQCTFSNDGKLYLLENTKGVLLKIDKNKEIAKTILPNYVPTQYLIAMIIAIFAIYIVFTVTRKPRA